MGDPHFDRPRAKLSDLHANQHTRYQSVSELLCMPTHKPIMPSVPKGIRSLYALCHAGNAEAYDCVDCAPGQYANVTRSAECIV